MNCNLYIKLVQPSSSANIMKTHEDETKQQKQEWLAARICQVMLLVVGPLWLCQYYILNISQPESSHTWPAQRCQMESKGVEDCVYGHGYYSCDLNVKYTYRYNNREYTSSRFELLTYSFSELVPISLGSKSSHYEKSKAETIIKNLPNPGESVPCYVSPRDPRIAILKLNDVVTTRQDTLGWGISILVLLITVEGLLWYRHAQGCIQLKYLEALTHFYKRFRF